MRLAERLRQIATALPEHGSVTLTRADIEELLVLEPAATSPAGDVAVDLTLLQVAERIGRSVSTVRAWCADGRLPNSYRLRGREWRIPTSDIVALQRAESARRTSSRRQSNPTRGEALTLDSWRKYA
jgi:excisionase family DNA binding protein